MPRAKRRITWSWVKIVMNVPPRVNGRRAVAPGNDQDPGTTCSSSRSSAAQLVAPRAYHGAVVDPIGGVEGQQRNFDVCIAGATALDATSPSARVSGTDRKPRPIGDAKEHPI